MSNGKKPMLGYGLMRLPEKDGAIDMPALIEMVDAFMAGGCRYFDTAYVYVGGKSESALREALVERYPRDAFSVATKLPAWEIKCEQDRDRIFNEQLQRVGVSYFDNYLLHSVEDGFNQEIYEKYDCYRWALQKKAEGQIRRFGFSFHGTPELLTRVLDAYPEVEFVQIQLNYLDWNNPVVQSGKLYEILRQRGIPMIIMEPVKGGRLASLTPELDAMLKAARPNDSVASWAMRFVASLEGIETILSGMSEKSQVLDNLKTFSQLEMLSESEKELLQNAVDTMLKTPLIQCTSCRYCCDGCPAGISIPDVFRVLNTLRLKLDQFRSLRYYHVMMGKGGRASQCLGCGQCERVCPQHLPIVSLMRDAAEILDTPPSDKPAKD